VNLTLRVVGRRDNGFHDLESVVAFADVCDWLGFSPADAFDLAVEGPGAGDLCPVEDNLVARAERALARRVAGLRSGRFRLIKRLPAAAGLGGGSSDAAAALRALAEANGLALTDARVLAAAAEVGSDVPVCLAPFARTMSGLGDVLGAPLRLPPLHAILVNPRQAVATKAVFEALGLARGSVRPAPSAAAGNDASASLDGLAAGGNDLEPAAQIVLPVVQDMLHCLRRLPGAAFARMSGSGATCFAIFEAAGDARRARERLAAESPAWWIATTTLR
jgi:4-diphosphocytidyl-2-C-methyl-D-erythritol kinase